MQGMGALPLPPDRTRRGPDFNVAEPNVPGSELTIFLLTMGVGKEIWEQFGHDAIWIHDASVSTDIVYHWGLFDFRQPHFVPRFLRGEMLYSMGGFRFEDVMDDYRRLDRSVVAQKLDLTPAQRIALRARIEANDQPGRRDYLYNYFTDNCSTRVRDHLDAVIGGTLKRAAVAVQTGHSYRWQSLRLTQVGPLMATGIDVGLGSPSDHELTAWEAMFLPGVLHDFAKKVIVRDENGFARPLVESETVLYKSREHVEPASAPNWIWWRLAIGVVVAAAIVLLARARAGGARFALATVIAAYGLVAGLVGLLLFLLWTATHHTFAHRNENLFVLHPLWLALAVLVPLYLVRGTAAKATRWIATATAALALVGVVWHLLGLSRQENWGILAMTVFPALAVAYAVNLGVPRATPSAAEPSRVGRTRLRD